MDEWMDGWMTQIISGCTMDDIGVRTCLRGFDSMEEVMVGGS